MVQSHQEQPEEGQAGSVWPGRDSTPVKRVKFCNIQTVILGVGYTEFVLKNPEYTSQTADRVFRTPKYESLESVEVSYRALEASPRLAPSDQEELR